MKRQTVGLLGLLCLGPGLLAADAYKIHLREFPDAGKSATVTSSDHQAIDSRLKDEKGKEVATKKFTRVTKEEYAVTTDEKGGEHPKKFTRVYVKAESGDDKTLQKLPHHGQALVFEAARDGYKVTVKGDAKDTLPKDVRTRLEKGAKDTVLASVRPLLPAPDREVKVGETWQISGTALEKLTSGQTVDKDRSNGAGKLTKVYKKDGRLFGELELNANLFLKLKDGEGKISFTQKINAVIDGSDTAGSFQIKVTITGENRIAQDDKKFTVGGRTEGNVTVTITPQK